MKFLSDILAKAGLTVDGVVTLNNTATGQTPASNDNSTKLATTAWVRTFVQPYSLPIASTSILGGIKVGTGLSIDAGSGILSVTGGGAASIKSTQTFTATGGQTVFTITGGYIVGLIDIFLNGVYLSPNQTTATNGTSITLGDAALAGDIIDVIIASPVFQGATTTTDQLSEGTTNLYFTNARARAAISETVTGLDYNSSTGVLSITTGYGIPTTASQTTWDAAYNDKINSAAVTGTTTKTLTLTQQDGGTVTATWTDDNTDAVTSVFGRTGVVVAVSGDYTTTLVTEGTNLYYTDARARAAISVTGSGSYDSATGVITVTGGVTSVNTLTGAVVLTTTNIAEGTNLYYTQARFDTAFTAKSTTNLTEGTNLYYTSARANADFDTRLATKSTSNLSEGTNLYYTDTRVGTYLTNNSYATQTYVNTAVSNLVDAAPGTLDTLNELAAALGDDPNFATTVATSIGTKEPAITAGTTGQYWRGDKSWQTLPIYTLSGLGGVPTTRTITINGTAQDLSADRTFTINSMVYPGAGIALSTGSAWGTSITDNSANWNTAFGWGNHASGGYLTTASAASTYVSLSGSYANPSWITSLAYSKITGVPAFLTSYTETDPYRVTSVAVSGTSTKTITLTRADASTVTTTWTDYDTDTNTYLTSAGFSGGTLTLTRNDAGTVTVSLDGRYYLATNPSSYISSYTETDTLASVTGRGATTTASISAANFQNGYQVLSLNNIKTPGLYNYDGGITGTQPLGTEWYNVRTIEVGADSRYSQFVMPYNVDRIFYRRKSDAGFAAYVELYHTGNLPTIPTNNNQLTNGAGYITGISFANVSSKPTTLSGYGITDAVYTTTSSFTTAGTGWYRVATTAGDGRGYYYIEVYTTGGNHNPSYLRIEAMGDWGNDKLIAAYTDLGFPASAVRITRSASTTFIEVNFSTTILGASMRVVRLGFDSTVSVLSDSLSVGGGTVQETLSITSKINTASLSINGNTVLHAGNYTSYSPSLTGTGASGTWGISISGSAANATDLNAADATQINFNSVTNTDYSTMTFMSRAWSAVQGANGLAYNFTTHTNAGSGGYGALQIYYGESGYVLAPTSFRSPYFYDSTNTAFYLRPASTSVLNSATFSGAVTASNLSGTNTGDQTNISGTALNITQYTINQSVGTGNGPTFADVYTNGWFRNNNVNTGLYNQSSGNHFYSGSASIWNITAASNSSVKLNFRTTHESTIFGTVYADSSLNVGFLTQDQNWGLRVDSSKNIFTYGTDLTVGNSTSSNIYMTDTDESTRRIHCNSGRIGFLTTANGWGAYCDNSGNWFANNLSGTNTGDQTNISGNAGTVSDGVYLSSTQSISGIKYFVSNRNTSSDSPPLQAYSSNGSGAIMSFHRGGYYAVNMGLDSDNVFRIGGWSAAANRLQLDMSGNLTVAGAIAGSNFSGSHSGSSSGTNTGDQTNISGSAGSAGYAGYLSTAYAGGQQTNPQVYFNNGVGLKAAMTGAWSVWSDTLWINGYAGGDVLQMCALHTLRNGTPRMSISVQASTSTSYGAFYEFITEYNKDTTITTLAYGGATRLYTGSDGTRNSGWAYHNDNGTGLHWPNNGWHFYPKDASDMYVRSGDSGASALVMNTAGTTRGYVYANSSNQIGFLSNGRGWTFRVHSDGRTDLGGDTAASIYIPRHLEASTTWGTCGCLSLFLGWSSSKVVIGNGNSGGHDYANGLGSNSVVATNPFYCYQDITAYSDSRVKENVEVVDNAVEKVKAIRGVTFTRNDVEDKNKRHAGVIAQEVLAVLPEVVSEDLNGHYSVAYGNLNALLIEAIKEQQTQIESQKSEIDVLKDLVQQLINR